MKIKKKSIISIKEKWNELLSQNEHISPFQDYDFAYLLAKTYYSNKAWNEFPQFYVIYNDFDEIVMIVPLIKAYTRKGVCYRSFGARFRIVYEDFIYSDSMTIDEMKQCVTLLTKKFKNIQLSFLSETSLLYRVISEQYPRKTSEIMFMLNLPESYEQYKLSLSRKMRGTINTAYNRLQRDGKRFKFYVFNGNSMPKDEYKKFMEIYSKEYFDKWCHYTNPFVACYEKYFLKHKHPYTTTMNKIDSSICCILYIDESPAAIMGGYRQQNDNYIIIHRIAYDSKYSWYSPGIIALQELIKYMIEAELIYKLDLSKGDESYKPRMGAVPFYQYGYTLKDN